MNKEFNFRYTFSFGLQVPLINRAVMRLGCVCMVNRITAKAYAGKVKDLYSLSLTAACVCFNKPHKQV